MNKKHQDPFSRFSHDLWDILGHHRPRLAPSRHRSLWLQLRWPRSTCRAGLLRWRPKIWRLVFRLSLRQLTDWPVLNSHWDSKVKPTLGCPRVNWSPEITCGHHCVVLMMSSTQTLRHAGQRIFHRTKTSNSTTEAIFTQWVTEWHSPGGRHPSKALTCGKPWGRSFPDSAP